MSEADEVWRIPRAKLARMSSMLATQLTPKINCVAGTSAKIVSADTRRTALTIGYAQGSGILLWPDAGIASDTGWLLNAANSPFTFNLDNVGQAVQASWYYFATGGGGVLSILEVLLQDGPFDPGQPMIQVTSDGGQIKDQANP